MTLSKYATWCCIITAIILAYLTFLVAVQDDLHFLDGVNLIFHEAGHWIFFWGPEFLVVLGGTLGQLMVPLMCIIAFLREHRYVSALVTIWWLGENLINISVYVGDARTQTLPLLGGDAAGHDWTYLLSKAGLLAHDHVISSIIYHTGMLTMVLSITALLALAHASRPHPKL